MQHLPRTHSDHHPVLVVCEPEGAQSRGVKPFRVKAAWMCDPGFRDFVNSTRKMHERDLGLNIKEFLDMARH